MAQWQLADCLEPLEEDESNPTIPIHSEKHLREERDRLRQRKPGLAMVESPQRDMLSICLGGPFASFGWYPTPDERRRQGYKIALAGRLYSSQSVECCAEGIPAPISPEYLFPVEQAIEAIVFFYNHHELPKWISWREWDPVSYQWKVTPAAEAPQPVSAS